MAPEQAPKSKVWVGVLAAVIGVVVGGLVNISLAMLGPVFIPLPDGVDVSTFEKAKASMQLMQPANYLFPYLGHAVGTLVGAFLAVKLAPSGKLWFGLGIGGVFQLGGIGDALMLGGPFWFRALDLITAYFPMAYAGFQLAEVSSKNSE